MRDTTVHTARFAGAGVEIVADVAGPADGIPVILLHGGGQTRASWGAAVREGARRGFRMISCDLRGHGESGWAPDGDYDLSAYVADLTAVAATLPQAPFVVGASLGGMTAMVYVGDGGAARGLVLVDIVPRIEPAGAAKIRGFMHGAPDGFASLEEAADAVAAYLPHRERPKDVSGLARNLRQGDDGRYRWHWDPAMLGVSRQSQPHRVDAAARLLRGPVLLIRGQMSDIVSLEGAREFLATVPQAEFVDVAGADHMVAGDANDAFNDAMFSFLEKHRD